MPQQAATLSYLMLILGLFWLDRDRKIHTSPALWVAIVWVALAGSRSVSQWLDLGSPMSAGQYLEGSPFDRLVYTGLLVVGLVILANRKKEVGSLLQSNIPILVFFLYCAVSLTWSDFPDVAFKRWIKAVGDLVMVLVVVSDVDPVAAVKRLIARTSYLLIPLSVLLIKYYPDLGRAYDRWDGTARYTGVANNKNTLGMICLLFGVGCIWRILSDYPNRNEAGWRQRLVAQGIILAMVMWLFIKANSMTSLSCFLLASAFLVLMTLRPGFRRPAVVHFLVATIVTVSVAVLFLGIDPDILKMLGRNPTLTDRTEVWSLILSIPNSSLVGTGFESFWLGPRLEQIWKVYQWGPTEAHNGYLEIFLNLGWTGVILLGVVLVAGYRTVVAAIRRNQPMANLMFAYFIMGVIYNFTEAAFFRMMAPVWIFLLLAITRVPKLANREFELASQDAIADNGILIATPECSPFGEWLAEDTPIRSRRRGLMEMMNSEPLRNNDSSASQLD